MKILGLSILSTSEVDRLKQIEKNFDEKERQLINEKYDALNQIHVISSKIHQPELDKTPYKIIPSATTTKESPFSKIGFEVRKGTIEQVYGKDHIVYEVVYKNIIGIFETKAQAEQLIKLLKEIGDAE